MVASDKISLYILVLVELISYPIIWSLFRGGGLRRVVVKSDPYCSTDKPLDKGSFQGLMGDAL